jgi:hypothetical protein
MQKLQVFGVIYLCPPGLYDGRQLGRSGRLRPRAIWGTALRREAVGLWKNKVLRNDTRTIFTATSKAKARLNNN